MNAWTVGALQKIESKTARIIDTEQARLDDAPSRGAIAMLATTAVVGAAAFGASTYAQGVNSGSGPLALGVGVAATAIAGAIAFGPALGLAVGVAAAAAYEGVEKLHDMSAKALAKLGLGDKLAQRREVATPTTAPVAPTPKM